MHGSGEVYSTERDRSPQRGKKDNEPSIRREIRSPGGAPGGSTVAELAPKQPQVAPTAAPEAPTAPPGEGVTLNGT